MRRPLRSVLIGDTDHYNSEFIFGVQQGMARLGHWHSSVSIRQPFDVIVQRCAAVVPDAIWGHMLLWAPGGATDQLLDLCAHWRRRGTRVLIHDGDARIETRYPFDIASSVDLALCNHAADRSAWRIPQLRWPYFAFVQEEIADPVPEYACDLAFAGRLGGGLYQERTLLVSLCKARIPSFKYFPSPADPGHTLFRTPELAASATAVLGYGRPDALGWTDVRVFQYPGAGGVLLHDDVQGFLTPYEHYIPLPRVPTIEAIEEAVARAKELGAKIRPRAFQYVQQFHSSVVRVRQALREVGL